MKTISTCILLAVIPCEAVRAELITIFPDSRVHGVQSGSFTQQGLTITLSANVGTLHATKDKYGVANDVPGYYDMLDGFGGTNEAITFTFDQPVKVTQLTLELYTINNDNPELAKLKIGLYAQQDLEPTRQGMDVYDFTSANFLPAGEFATLSYFSGNGFSLQSIQVNTVPEPTTFTLSALAMAGLMLRRRDRRSLTV